MKLVYKRFGKCAVYRMHSKLLLVIRMFSDRYEMNMECNTDTFDKHDMLYLTRSGSKGKNKQIDIIKTVPAKQDKKIESYRYVWQI